MYYIVIMEANLHISELHGTKKGQQATIQKFKMKLN